MNRPFPGILAGITGGDMRDFPNNFSPDVNARHSETWLILGSIAAVVVMLLIWAVFIRKPPKQVSYAYPGQEKRSRRRLRRPDRSSSEMLPPAPEPEQKHRRRRRRRHHRPRNPTLSQTGGLPPIRSEGAAEP